MDNFKGETRQALLNRAFLYIVLIGFSFFIFLRVRALLFDLFVAVVLSVLAEPIVYRLSKRFNRRLSTIITVGTIILVIGGIIFSIIPIMVQELYLLSSNMPEYFDNIVKYFNSEGFSISNQSLNLEEEFNNLFREYGSAVGNTVVFAGRGILNAMFHFFVIFFFSFYLIAEGDGWRIRLKDALPGNISKTIDQVWTIGVSKAGAWIAARVILGILASIAFTISFLIIGLPSPFALGISAGLLSQLVPAVGTFLGGIVPVLASISLGPTYILYTLVVLVAYQFIENYFISPRVTKVTMDIHPAVAVFATIFGAYTAGVIGAVFLNLSTNAIKTADSLIKHAKEETYDEVEDSIKSLRKNFKAGNYFAIATFFIIFGISSVLTQVFNGNYFIQAMVYFSMSFLCILAFSFIIWRLLK